MSSTQQPDRNQIMRIEELQALQKQAQAPRQGCQPARNGRRKGDPLEFNPASGETFPDPSTTLPRRTLGLRRTGLFRAQAAGLFVGRVEPEIVSPLGPTINRAPIITVPPSSKTSTGVSVQDLQEMVGVHEGLRRDAHASCLPLPGQRQRCAALLR